MAKDMHGSGAEAGQLEARELKEDGAFDGRAGRWNIKAEGNIKYAQRSVLAHQVCLKLKCEEEGNEEREEKHASKQGYTYIPCELCLDSTWCLMFCK